MSWQKRVEREYLEADREFSESVLPVGSVNLSSFGLIADATRYLLVEEAGEVHIRPEITSLKEITSSLSRGGTPISPRDAEAAVAEFARLWEEKIKARGKWEELVRAAREAGEISSPRKPARRWRLLGR